MHSSGVAVRRVDLSKAEGSTLMADLAYALLLVGVFVLVALGVRGLEKL
ncbi:hypothetical protein ACQPZF_15615 [Actinosynnema sp. CS-041913]